MDRLRLRSSIEDLKSLNLWISLIAECLGTFILVYIGSHSGSFKVNSLKVGMGFGFGGAVAIYCIGNISGGNINPAVSFGLLIARQISLVRFVFYVISQTLGAVVAAKFSEFSNIYKNRTASPVKVEESNVELFVCEIIITFFLVFTVMRLCVERSRTQQEKAFAPLMIGVAIMLGVFSGGEIGGGSMNPAASIGLQYRNRRLWIFVVAPLIGGCIAALLQQLVFTSKLSKEYLKEYLLGSNFGEKDTKKVEKTDETLKHTDANAQTKEAETSA